MLHFGAHVIDPPADPHALVARHKQLGYTAAYVPKNLTLADAPRLNDFRTAFQNAGILLAEVGAWCNLLSTDLAERKKNVDYVCERLALADEIGALCCIDYLGTLAPGQRFGPDPRNFSPEGFSLAVDTVRSILDAVKPRRTKFALEFMTWCLPDSTDSALALLHAIDRPSFAIHLDPVNIILSPRHYYDTASVIRDAFTRLGPHIVSCHAKDIIAREEVILHLDEVLPGQGALCYQTFLTEAARLNRPIPIMLEHLKTNDDYQLALHHLQRVATQNKLPFAS